MNAQLEQPDLFVSPHDRLLADAQRWRVAADAAEVNPFEPARDRKERARYYRERAAEIERQAERIR